MSSEQERDDWVIAFNEVKKAYDRSFPEVGGDSCAISVFPGVQLRGRACRAMVAFEQWNAWFLMKIDRWTPAFKWGGASADQPPPPSGGKLRNKLRGLRKKLGGLGKKLRDKVREIGNDEMFTV